MLNINKIAGASSKRKPSGSWPLCVLLVQLALGLGFFLAEAASAAELSFDRARSLLQERSNALKAAEAHVESRQQAADSLKWLHGPSIAVGAVELWGEAKIDIDRSVSTPLGPMPLRIDETYNFSGPRAAFTGKMPIFTGGKIGAVQDAARAGVEEAKALARNQANLLDADLVAKYFGLQLALSLEKLRQATLAEEERELARARKFEQQGMISHVEFMGVKVGRDAAEREWLKARNHVRQARVELQRLLQGNSLGVLTTPLFVLKKSLPPMEEWVELALKNNPQLAAVDARVEQADQGVNASRSAWFPQVVAFGQYYFAKPSQAYVQPDWLAGLGVNLTLWDSRDRLADFKSARATLRQARSMQAETANLVRTGAETAWINTQNAREQYNLTASDVALARENLKLKSKGFGEGLFTALDVTHARNQLLAAEVERRVAAYEFVVNYALLHLVSGRMAEFLNACTGQDFIAEN